MAQQRSESGLSGDAAAAATGGGGGGRGGAGRGGGGRGGRRGGGGKTCVKKNGNGGSVPSSTYCELCPPAAAAGGANSTSSPASCVVSKAAANVCKQKPVANTNDMQRSLSGKLTACRATATTSIASTTSTTTTTASIASTGTAATTDPTDTTATAGTATTGTPTTTATTGTTPTSTTGPTTTTTLNGTASIVDASSAQVGRRNFPLPSCSRIIRGESGGDSSKYGAPVASATTGDVERRRRRKLRRRRRKLAPLGSSGQGVAALPAEKSGVVETSSYDDVSSDESSCSNHQSNGKLRKRGGHILPLLFRRRRYSEDKDPYNPQSGAAANHAGGIAATKKNKAAEKKLFLPHANIDTIMTDTDEENRKRIASESFRRNLSEIPPLSPDVIKVLYSDFPSLPGTDENDRQDPTWSRTNLLLVRNRNTTAPDISLTTLLSIFVIEILLLQTSL